MPTKLNRPVNYLLLLITLTATGCTENNKNTLAVNELSLDSLEKDNDYIDHYYQNYQTIDKAEIEKKAAAHKGTVWERLLSLYSLPKIENERIDREINWYLNHPNALNTIQHRAEPYLHLILDEIESKKIPGELALLPVVESAFLPNAYSKADASGLWQFIPATGRMFGLQQNAWYDGRRDIYASTKAATTYLKQLSQTFDGDWLLALASYNCGKGNVKKSIERNELFNLPTDYWSLNLPEETTNYVPRLLAIAKIFSNADDYKVNLHHIPNKPYFEVIHLDAQLDLNKAAQLADMTLNDFLKLNPAFNKAKTAPEGAGPRRLLIPVEKAESFKENLAQLPFEEWVSHYDDDESKPIHLVDVRQDPVRHHDVKDVKIVLSKMNAVNQQKAKTSSPLKSQLVAMAPKNQSKPAISASLPLKKVDSKSTTIALAHKNVTPITTKIQSYIVKKGDTLTNLAQKFSVTGKAILDSNKLATKDTLLLGQKLIIKASAPANIVTAAANKTSNQQHVIKKTKSSG
jgi:membrane-bound lytic murein transglycosylase D